MKTEVTLDAIEAWLKGLPADEVVDPMSGPPCCSCVVANYLKAQGIERPFVGPGRWGAESGRNKPIKNPQVHSLEVGRFIRAVDSKRKPIFQNAMTAAEALSILNNVREASK